MEIINMKLEDLIPYEKNPRINDGAVDKVAESIKEFGFKVPIIVDKDNVIVAGHTRKLASEKLGLKEVPVVIAEDLNKKQIKAFRLADNRVSEESEWDNDLLIQELQELEGMFTGFDDKELDDLLGMDEEEENPYTEKVTSPQYDITGEEPELSQLYDTTKTDALLEEIAYAEVSPEVKSFMMEAARRHTVFNYKNIAEYYAHAEPEVQELMERSALIIIDYEDAIRNGYVSLNEDILEMMENDDQ